MGKTERKDGLYYVRFMDSTKHEWIPAQLTHNQRGESWMVLSYGIIPERYLEIGPRIPEYKPKKKQTKTK